MGNDTSSTGGVAAPSVPGGDATRVLVFGSSGVGKRSVWMQALTGKHEFDVEYAGDNRAGSRLSMQVETAEMDGVPVESVFASCDDATSTILTARFRQVGWLFAAEAMYDACCSA